MGLEILGVTIMADFTEGLCLKTVDYLLESELMVDYL